MASARKILIADDDANDVIFLTRALEKCGIEHSIDSVRDGEAAIEYLKSKPNPDLVFLDLKMPKVDGFEVLDWLGGRGKLRCIPVVVLSSSALEEDKSKALELGAREYRVKPQDFEGLRKMAVEICKHWLGEQGVNAFPARENTSR